VDSCTLHCARSSCSRAAEHEGQPETDTTLTTDAVPVLETKLGGALRPAGAGGKDAALFGAGCLAAVGCAALIRRE